MYHNMVHMAIIVYKKIPDESTEILIRTKSQKVHLDGSAYI